jgi:hypothetical protein
MEGREMVARERSTFATLRTIYTPTVSIMLGSMELNHGLGASRSLAMTTRNETGLWPRPVISEFWIGQLQHREL